jgi:hypothetical protein
MGDDDTGVELEDTSAMWNRRVEERLGELQAEVEVSGKLNAALAEAVGLTRSEPPKKLLRELKALDDRIAKIELPKIDLAPMSTD